MTGVDALFVDGAGVYPHLIGGERCWTFERDACTYAGPGPVVAHPPCQLWTAMCNVNYKRYGGEHNRPGNDGGCFASALANVRRCGGVLEHPALSKAFAAHGIHDPKFRGKRANAWLTSVWGNLDDGWTPYWVTEVSQCAYGHRARKRTWLLYVGVQPPFDLDWSEPPYTHQIGHDSKMKRPRPALGKRAASATPQAFALELIRLAEWSRGEP